MFCTDEPGQVQRTKLVPDYFVIPKSNKLIIVIKPILILVCFIHTVNGNAEIHHLLFHFIPNNIE
ncbi:hypothetical protein TH53_13715 [Pedobacter lusitanus]|uniref:Uncharacterized protein n=1 Tax=Pedobacter lusitanus TaxID=1503925 RepID=A0A0D0F4Q2_9SPHI|nr:hypothetical protein TH53_13715 [Pedobacter lusitanus]